MTPPAACSCAYTLTRSHRHHQATGDPYTYHINARDPGCRAQHQETT